MLFSTIVTCCLVVSGTSTEIKNNKSQLRKLQALSSSSSSCNDHTSSLNAILYAGEDPSSLHALASSHPDDGYLTWATSPNATASYDNSIYIPTSSDTCKGIGFHWTIITNTSTSQDTIQIAAAFQTNSQQGWGAIGFSETGGMRGADVVYFSTSDFRLVDAHVLDYLGYPIADNRQDWTLINHLITDDGYLIFEASRDLDTDDVFDRPFVDDSSVYVSDHRLIGAWGSTPYVMYHGRNRAHTSVQLFYSPDDGNNDIGAGLDYENFLREMSSRSEGSAQMTLKNLAIPMRTTYYHEECFSISDLIDLGFFSDSSSIRYVIGYEFIIQPASRKYIHHMIAFASYDQECDNSQRAPLFAWTPGEDYLYFPTQTGMKIGGAEGFRSFALQYHFDNKARDPGKVDTGSGIRLYYTTTAVRDEIGNMQVGDPAVKLKGRNVGAGLTRHSILCPSRCTKNRFVDEEITIVKESLHMHSHGKRIVNTVIRDGTEIHESYIDYWDFEQTGIPAPRNKPFQVKKGDSFRTICYYDADSNTKFGVGSDDEMCMAFILYFPKQPLETCGVSHRDQECRALYLGSTVLQSEDQFGRVFGNSKNTDSPTVSPTILPFGPTILPSSIASNAPTLTPSKEEEFPRGIFYENYHGLSFTRPINNKCWKTELFEGGVMAVDYSNGECSNDKFIADAIFSTYDYAIGNKAYFKEAGKGWSGHFTFKETSSFSYGLKVNILQWNTKMKKFVIELVFQIPKNQ